MTDLEYKELYESGLTTREIAKRAGNVTGSTVRLHLINIGVTLRNRWENNKGLFKKEQVPHNKTIFTEDQLEIIRERFLNYTPIKQIAEELNLGEKPISRITKELELVRDLGKMMSRPQYDSSKDEEIIHLYNSGKSSTEIGKLLGMEHSSVLGHLEHCGVAIRTLSEAQFNFNKKIFPNELENFETLYDMYVTRDMSKKEIGLQLNVSPDVVDRVLRKFNIPVRGVAETVHQRVSYGPESSNWKGGRTGIYMRLRSLLASKQTTPILMRDKYTCQCCGSTEHLEVHHIRRFRDIFNEILEENKITSDNLLENEEELFMKMKDDPRFLDPDNLITYCRDCHLFKIHGYKRNRTLNSENTEEDND